MKKSSRGKQRFRKGTKGRKPFIKAPKSAKYPEATFYILDRFSAEDIDRWTSRHNDLYDFYWSEFSYYAQARSRRAEQLREALLSQTSEFSFSNWYRMIDFQYSQTPLSAMGSRISVRGGRFNIGLIDETKFPNFACLYISESESTCYSEKFQRPKVTTGSNPFLGPDLALKTESSYSVVRLEGALEIVLDVSNESNLKPFLKHLRKMPRPSEDMLSEAVRLGINAPTAVTTMTQLKDSLLDKNWSAYPVGLGIPFNSQIFGQIAKTAGIQGLRYKSKFDGGQCLAIFPDNLNGSASYIQIMDPVKAGVTKRMDSSTWSTLV